MTVAAGHELKHKAAMSKPGDVAVGIPISTEYQRNPLVLWKAPIAWATEGQLLTRLLCDGHSRILTGPCLGPNSSDSKIA